MLAFAILVTPQWDRLPWWLLALCIVLASWRWLAQLGRVRLPGRLIRLAIMAAAIAVYVATVKGRFSVDTASSFFVLAVGLKWLETRTARDFYVLFFILVYLATVNFLFQQDIGWALLNLTGVTFLFIGLQVLNAPRLKGATWASWRRLGVMLLKTLPIVVLLFVFFPRMPPLWSVPLVSNQARTGISDTMTPGSISDLAQSSERAFRVTFGGKIPSHRDRYWRGLVLDQLEGETWVQGLRQPFERAGMVNIDGGIGALEDDEYDVLLEATNQRWAFALDGSMAVSGNLVSMDGDLFRLRRPADTAVRYRLAFEDSPEGVASVQPVLSPSEHRQYLQLPIKGNPRTRALARQWASEMDKPLELANRFLQRLKTDAYFYTLRPPTMPEDGIDALLFDVRRGFCAHYAGAMTFFLRAAGIPARVVVGYQGGSTGAGDEYLIVRQYDAHAWVEVWLSGSGWVRVDPTAAISPERIESGLRDAVAEEGSFLEDDWASPQRYGDIELIQWASLRLDMLNYQWTRWVVGYQGQSQMNLMSRLPGNLTLRELGYVTAGLIATALLVAAQVTAARQHRGRPSDPVRRSVDRWQRLLRRHGVKPVTGETPEQLARRASGQYPQARKLLHAFAALVNKHYYGAGDMTPADRRALKQLIPATRHAIKSRPGGSR
nr:DUF3488 and transglutaminase-like domain-containing protein [Marinobacter salicampi]